MLKWGIGNLLIWRKDTISIFAKVGLDYIQCNLCLELTPTIFQTLYVMWDIVNTEEITKNKTVHNKASTTQKWIKDIPVEHERLFMLKIQWKKNKIKIDGNSRYKPKKYSVSIFF